MMNIFMAIYCAILFFVLSPGILVRIPKNGSKYVVAGVHAVIFGVVTFFTCKFVWNVSQTISAPPSNKEGLADKKKEGLAHKKKEGVDNTLAQVTKPQLAQ